MTNQQNRLFLKLLPYFIISFISTFIYWILEVGLLGDNATYPFSDNVYKPGNSYIAITISGVILGTGLGWIEEVFFKTKFRSRSFITKIALKTFIYLTVLLLLLFVQSLLLNAINSGLSIFNEEVIQTVLIFFSSITFLSVVIYSGFMIAFGLFISEIIDYMGIEVVGSFFTGKYNKSVIEERIFMFLDMKDSTTIAEKLGHENHYKLINEYYGDMTDAIIETKAHIYQYAGDEIILSWNLAAGIHKTNCIKCFYLIRKSIKEKEMNYRKRYGLSPEFKAAVHYGKVSRWQVGFIKKELLFTGDVLNTTARIQSMCKKLKADLLISNTLRELITDTDFEFIIRGSFSLRGRKKE